jgi:hypothetical protein
MVCMAVLFTYPNGEERGNFHVQMISTVTAVMGLEGGNGSAPCDMDPSKVPGTQCIDQNYNPLQRGASNMHTNAT